MTPDERLSKMLDLLSESLTKHDFEAAFEEVLAYLEAQKKLNLQEFEAIHKNVADLSEKLKTGNSMDLSEIRKECQALMAQMMKEQVANLTHMREAVNRVKSGKDGKTPVKGVDYFDGKPGDPGQDAPIKTPQEVRDELETLQGDERLAKEAIKGIDQIEERVNQIELRPLGRGGAKGIGLYINGSKKLLTAQTINLIGGTNVTLTYNNTSGRNDITINASGGSGTFSVLTATGTVDDSNKVFTFVSAPVIVVVNGTSYRDGHGVAISGTTATIDFPPGTGGDIYGISG